MATISTKYSRKLAQGARRGAITVLAAILSILMLGMVAFSVDIGYVLSMKEEMQRTADSAALAACWDYGKNLAEGTDQVTADQSARASAQLYTSSNSIGGTGPAIDLNAGNAASGDLVFGYVSDLYDPSSPFDTTATANFNAVRIRIRRDNALNGEAPSFFAKFFGHDGQPLYAEATAAMVRDVAGFRTPNGGMTVNLLPFALDLGTWQQLVDGVGPDVSDDYTWTKNGSSGTVSAGSDGWMEVNLYPVGNGSPGNRGTVDIGGSNNSTADIARQILHGVSGDDLAHHGGSLQFDSNGELSLEGDTGISAGVKDELNAVKGDPRTIPVFSVVNGPGNNAVYTIVRWQGFRIMDVKLTGPVSKKHVTIQVAPAVGPGAIPSTVTGTSTYTYSPAVLIE